MPAFPYGFPTSYGRAFSGGIVWPRCVNAEPGTYGHECSKPATCIGADAETGAQACFCDDCAMNGSEGRRYANLQPIGPAPVGLGSWVRICDPASAYAWRLGIVVALYQCPPQPTPIAIVQVRSHTGGAVTLAARVDKLRLAS